MEVDLGLHGRYLCVMFRVLLIILLVAFHLSAWPAQSGEVSEENPAEYMIYQYPDVSLVVKIDAPEAEFTSTIIGTEGALVASSGIPAARIGPLYQYIPSVETPRQLMIKISPARKLDRSRIKLELIQLSGRDRNSPAYVRAYQLFTNGTSLTHSNDTTTWSMKIYTLRNAAEAFASMGWEEMRLWSEYYAAHLILHKLGDELMAMEFAQEIRKAAGRAGFSTIELAALILEGESLMNAGQLENSRLEQAHAVLDRIVLLARQEGFHSEQARALFNDGLAYQQQGMLEEAVGQFQKALDVSLSSDDPDLVNEIRSTAANAYETQGSTSGAIEMLDDIGGDLNRDAGQEFTDNLFEKGRILNASFRYAEAAIELSQALALQKGNPEAHSWGATGLALAWSLYSMGEFERAEALMLESIPRTPQSENAAAVARAYSSLANIYRDRGQFRQMEYYREKQGGLVRTDALRAPFLLESGLDSRRREGADSSQARDLITQSRHAASRGGQSRDAQRASMMLCLLSLERNGSGACTAASVAASFQTLAGSGIPWLALEAGRLKAGILHREGRNREALAVMENLVGDILFYRQTLPGVLGAWFWRNKESVFRDYMSINLALAGGGGNSADGRRVLLALDHIRLIERDAGSPDPVTILSREEDESLRSLLARRETAAVDEATGLARQLEGEFDRLRKSFSPAVAPLQQASLDTLLSGLSGEESVLTYYFASTADYVLLGTQKGVSLRRLGGSGKTGRLLHGLREQIGGPEKTTLSELDAMGRALAGPISEELTAQIYLLPAGALNGFPFDVLRLDGRFLAEKHAVVNLMSLDALANQKPVLSPDYRERVFLAGNPQASQDLFSYDIHLSAEVASLTDEFVGPGLHIVQGVALRKDEFQDSRFTGASLIHLAIPGTLDLVRPSRSWLQMSGADTGEAPQHLTPGDIAALGIDAGLVVLSRTGVEAGSRSGFGTRLGFVSEFLEAGANFVVASSWSVGDAQTAAFMKDFYLRLESNPDVSEALLASRMRQMEAGDEANIDSWAGFQLYIR